VYLHSGTSRAAAVEAAAAGGRRPRWLWRQDQQRGGRTSTASRWRMV